MPATTLLRGWKRGESIVAKLYATYSMAHGNNNLQCVKSRCSCNVARCNVTYLTRKGVSANDIKGIFMLGATLKSTYTATSPDRGGADFGPLAFPILAYCLSSNNLSHPLQGDEREIVQGK